MSIQTVEYGKIDVPKESLTSVASITIPTSGMYIVIGYFKWGASFQTVYSTLLAVGNVTKCQVRNVGTSGGGSVCVFADNLSANNVVHLNAYQETGGTVGTNGVRLSAVRIK